MSTVTVQLDSGPRNARIDPDTGLRWYRWQGQDLVSVTSGRSMAGMPHNLHRWYVRKICDRATAELDTLIALMTRERKPRERVLEKNRAEEARRWLRQAPEEERDYKALRGTAVHEAAEKKLRPAEVTDYRKVVLKLPLLDDMGQQAVTDKGTPRQHRVERRGFGLEVPEGVEIVEDLTIPADEVRSRLRQYLAWLDDSRAEILVSEGQVWNLELGYAGSFDILCRFPNGEVWIVDLKTGDESYSDYVLQQAAYLMAEFVGADDVIDEAATQLLHQVAGVAILHLHEDSWEFLRLSIDNRAWAAFRGLLAYATWTSEHAASDTFVVASRKGSATAGHEHDFRVPSNEHLERGEDRLRCIVPECREWSQPVASPVMA